jgi:DNA-binding IclR family transcriptional regulator
MVRSVERAAQIMDLLLGSGTEGKRVTELSRDLGLHKTTVVRLLQTLVAIGAVRKDEDTNRYSWEPLAGIALISRARDILSRTDMVQEALRELADASGETAYVARLDVRQREMAIAAVARPKGMGWVHLAVGNRLPAHVTAVGKICLAYMSSAEIAEWVKGGLARRTRHTITSEDRLRRELRRYRRQGYALNRGEATSGLSAVAVVLWDERRRPMAAVGVTPLLERMTEEAIERWVPLLKESSEKISQILYAGFGSVEELLDGTAAPAAEGRSGSRGGPTK